MRKIAAHFIINPGENPIKNGILELDAQGRILNIRQSTNFKEESHLEFYNGVLCPGFVNIHTHLELSHLKTKLKQGTGISSFVDQVIKDRGNYTIDPQLFDNELARMHQSGTQAIGDISNTNHTLGSKLKTPILSHSFIEVFGLNPDYCEGIWEKGLNIESEFLSAGLKASLTPHAPYSVSSNLWKKFREYPRQSANPLSIHHMESEEEEEFMNSHSGKMADRFLSMGISSSTFPSPPKSSTSWLSDNLSYNDKIILIHNTFSKVKDLETLFSAHPSQSFYIGLCPRSNLFIEKALPDNMIKNRRSLQLCIGTDSLASNHSLSLWGEIKTLAAAYPDISLNEYIEMACINGANALNMDNEIGSFQKGKKPGVVLIEGLDLQQLRVTQESKTKRIV